MSNAIPIPVTVPASGVGPWANVQNLGADLRKIVFDGASIADKIRLWGSLDGVSGAPVEVLFQNGETRYVDLSGNQDSFTFSDRSLFYAAERTGGSGAASLAVTGEDVGAQLSAASGAFRVRNMGPAADVANLAAYTVAGNDGVNNVAGDVVALYAQTDPTENGPYVVGGVAAGVAPLTRPSWWAAGATIQPQQEFTVAAGTLFGSTVWFANVAAPFEVGADDPNLLPEYVGQQIVLTAGDADITNVPIRSTTDTAFTINRIAAVGTANTVQYNPRAVAAGPFGTATATIEGQIAAGTPNAADESTLNVGIHNR